MRGLARSILDFAGSRAGNFASIAAILFPVLAGIAGLSVDFSMFYSQRSKMQAAADSAALAAIRESSLQGWKQATAESVASGFIEQAFRDSYAVYSSSVSVDEAKKTLTVSLRQDGYGYFMLGLFQSNPQIDVSATASMASSASICLLTLDPKSGRALNLSGVSSVTAKNCGVMANSIDANAIEVVNGAKISAGTICSSGGFKARPFDISPPPVTDCPPVPDPLAERQPPTFGGCNYLNLDISALAILRPGVYCGGLRIRGNAVVTALPGIYIIKDGLFEIAGNATLLGENVGFYLTGSFSKTKFGTSTTISLSAPKSGPMAGILVFEDRNSLPGREFEISSKDARKLVGALYLPKGKLVVKGASQFGLSSQWTSIIAREVEIAKGPVLTLNSDYGSSDIPVPVGISGAEKIYLAN